MDSKISTATEINPETLYHFLRRFFSENKANFLKDYGNWLYKGNNNQWALQIDSEIAGYCAVIPDEIIVDEEIVPSLWWLDLIIAPEYRGKGLQTIFDKKIQEYNYLKVGFPNRLAYEIHKKHGWGVRDNLNLLLLPLQPRKVIKVQQSTGWRRSSLLFISFLVTPLIKLFLLSLKLKKFPTSKKLDHPTPDQLAAVFKRCKPKGYSTTNRNTEYFEHRFFASPYFNDLSFYIIGPEEIPSHYLITRKFIYDGTLVLRILDLYGDFNDPKSLRELICYVVSDNLGKGISQITSLATMPTITKALESCGFLVRAKVRFCWKSDRDDLMNKLNEKIYWTYADSDNDEIV